MNALFGASFSLENSHIAPNNINSLLYFKTKTCITLVVSNFVPPDFRKVKPPAIGKVKPPNAKKVKLGTRKCIIKGKNSLLL